MAEIHKFSLLYVAAEDRLALDTEDVEGATTRLWLTQRLCRGLVAALVPILQTAVPPALSGQPHETAQAWEQAAAMADFGKTPGVQSRTDSIAGLVEAVHIRPAAGQTVFTFDFGAGDARVVSLTLPALRQTLAVMHRLHVEAGWPLDLWPAWIADPSAQAGGGAVN